MRAKQIWVPVLALGAALASGCDDKNFFTNVDLAPGGMLKVGGGINGEMIDPDGRLTDPSNAALVAEGQRVFRFETFGDERQWTDALQLHKVVEAALTPALALQLGFKVDMDALPAAVVEGVVNGDIPLDDPQTTLALISLNAVVGVQGKVSEGTDGKLHLDTLGITCALCHSTVDDAAEPIVGVKGIGHRLDGWPNRDFDPGAVIALSPAISGNPAVANYYNSWGAGMFDPRVNHDGMIDASGGYPVVIPPAFGLDGMDSVVFNGDGNEIAYWNRYVAVTEMGGVGHFADNRLRNAEGGVVVTDNKCTESVPNCKADMVTEHLPALQAYQRSLVAPKAPEGSFDVAMADQGKALFNGKAQCSTCHFGDKLSDGNVRLHPKEASVAARTGYLDRSGSRLWRTTPLAGIWQHPPYFHDGSAATLGDVVDAYDTRLTLNLSGDEKSQLVEYLKSL